MSEARIRTRVTEQFGIRHPILCAPMALVAGGELAASVTRAGGLGIVGGGYAGALGGEPKLDAELARAAEGKFGVGFITWALERSPQTLTAALKHSPCCVFLSFGDPRPFANEIRAAGAKLMCQVQSMEHVALAIEARADAIVAQGTEAGGHGAARSTLPFVPEASDYLKEHSPETLLLASGGIADGRGLAAALMLGAEGIVMGTRFWASAEAMTPETHTNRAISATGDATVRTKSLDALRGTPWPKEFSFRFMKNKLTDEWAEREDEAFEAYGSYAQKYTEARSKNDLDIMAVVGGEAVGLVKSRPSAETIVRETIEQACALLKKAGTLDFAWPKRSPRARAKRRPGS